MATTSSALLRFSSSSSSGSVLLLQRRSRTVGSSRLATASYQSNRRAISNSHGVAFTAWQQQQLRVLQEQLYAPSRPASSYPSSYYRGFATHATVATEATDDDTPNNDNDSNDTSSSAAVDPPISSALKQQQVTPRATSNSFNSTITHELLDPVRVMDDIVLASQVNQGSNNKGGKSGWDPAFCRQAVARYHDHLQYLAENNNRDDDNQYHLLTELVSSEMTCRAIRALLRCNLPTRQLSQRVRELEKLIGTIGQTALTEPLSLHLLQANGLAGNVGRTLALLQLRKSRDYTPHAKEFTWAVQAITSASLELRTNRNVYKSEGDLSTLSSQTGSSSSNASLDNPTRFLDAILINMYQRGVPLDIQLATTMLETYASTGRTGKALHFHYKVSLPYTNDDDDDEPQTNNSMIDEGDTATSISRRRRRSVRLKWNAPAPYYKIPSEIQPDQLLAMPGSNERRTKSDFESRDSWSLPLTAAFSFCDSLTHGACGHEALVLDLPAYNAMMKVCCYRGALWRAMEILHKTIPDAGLEANTISYLRVLDALARVGDAKTQSILFHEMVQKNVPLNRQVISTMVNGMLNTGNIAGAISFIQDVFNQYNLLPPYTTHLKLLEMALASTDSKTEPYEAKRHVYFLQQLWRWEPNDYHSKSLRNQVATTKGHVKLSKAALQDMFEYFGHSLREEDFFEEFQEPVKEEEVTV